VGRGYHLVGLKTGIALNMQAKWRMGNFHQRGVTVETSSCNRKNSELAATNSEKGGEQEFHFSNKNRKP